MPKAHWRIFFYSQALSILALNVTQYISLFPALSSALNFCLHKTGINDLDVLAQSAN
jgi:hypothetical protein